MTQIINAESINSNHNLMDKDNFLILQRTNHNSYNTQYQINTNFITYNLKRMKKRRLYKYETIRDIGIKSNIETILNNNQSITKLSSLATNTATTTTATITTATEEQQQLRQRRHLYSEIFDKHNNRKKISTNVTSLTTNNNSSNIIIGSTYNDTTSSKFNSTEAAANIIGMISTSAISTVSNASTTKINSTSNPSSSLTGRYVATGTGIDGGGPNGAGVVGNSSGVATTVPTHTTRNIIAMGTTAIVTNGKRPTIIIYPTVSPESIVIPIVSCILGFPLLALMVICCLRRRAKLARERDRRRNYDMQDHAVSLVRFSPIHRLNNRSSRVISLRPERSLSRGFPSLELDTVVEERSSDHEQTQTDILSPESPSDPQKYRGFNSS